MPVLEPYEVVRGKVARWNDSTDSVEFVDPPSSDPNKVECAKYRFTAITGLYISAWFSGYADEQNENGFHTSIEVSYNRQNHHYSQDRPETDDGMAVINRYHTISSYYYLYVSNFNTDRMPTIVSTEPYEFSSPLVWDAVGEKTFETGVKKGVLFVMNDDGTYQNGVAWNGLISVTESNSGAEETALWADDIKYASMRSAEEFSATIEAYNYPKEFKVCDGSLSVVPGLDFGQQSRKRFGFSYVTTEGNDVSGTDYNYKIHIIYNAYAAPSEKSYQTINDSPDAITHSWEVNTLPIAVTNHKPTSHLIFNVNPLVMNENAVKEVEKILYGSTEAASRILMPEEIDYIVRYIDD